MSCLYTASEGLNNLPLSQPLISKSALLEINSGFHPFLERFEADFQPFEAILKPFCAPWAPCSRTYALALFNLETAVGRVALSPNR